MIWEAGLSKRKEGKKGRERAFFPLVSIFSFSQDSSSPIWHMSYWGGVNLPRGWGPLFSSACHSSQSPFLCPSIYISKQAMSRSKTVTNDEVFHQWLAWCAEIVYGEVSLIISRWVCCLAQVCELPGSCHCFILSLSPGARRCWRGMCQRVSQENVFVIRKPYMPVN